MKFSSKFLEEHPDDKSALEWVLSHFLSLDHDDIFAQADKIERRCFSSRYDKLWTIIEQPTFKFEFSVIKSKSEFDRKNKINYIASMVVSDESSLIPVTLGGEEFKMPEFEVVSLSGGKTIYSNMLEAYNCETNEVHRKEITLDYLDQTLGKENVTREEWNIFGNGCYRINMGYDNRDLVIKTSKTFGFLGNYSNAFYEESDRDVEARVVLPEPKELFRFLKKKKF